MSRPTEAEIDAAARAMHANEYPDDDYDTSPMMLWFDKLARIALRAAAEARDRERPQ